MGGFIAVGLLSPDMGETYEAVYHPAVFRTDFEARVFAARVKGKPVNLKNWVITGAPNSSYYLQREQDENPAFYSPLVRLFPKPSAYEA